VNKWTITKHELSRSLTKTFAAHQGAYFVTIFVEPLHKNHEDRKQASASAIFANFQWPQITILERSFSAVGIAFSPGRYCRAMIWFVLSEWFLLQQQTTASGHRMLIIPSSIRNGGGRVTLLAT
jgi:hypothetical protein